MTVSTYDAGSPWYIPEWYAVVTEDWVQKCIAPKVLQPGSKADRRCFNKIDREGDLAAVNRLKDEICRSIDPYEIVRKMRELVLLRCCSGGRHSHRGKLETDAVTRRLIAELYIDEFHRQKLLRVSVPRNLLLNDTSRVGQLQPYPLEKDEDLRTLLRQRVDLSPKSPDGHWLPTEGYVYVLSTQWPGVVKIGFSGRSGQHRLLEQEACLPSSQLIVQQFFYFPERIEQLIHLQLGHRRRKVMQCQNVSCRKTHVELFDVSQEDVKLVLQDWKDLNNMEPLYDNDRYLTDAWHHRLDFMTDEPRALAMIKVLKQERIVKEADRVREEEARARERARVEEDQRQQNMRQLRSRAVPTQVSDYTYGHSTPVSNAAVPNSRPPVGQLMQASGYWSYAAWQADGCPTAPISGSSYAGYPAVSQSYGAQWSAPVTYQPQPYSTKHTSSFDLQSLADTLPASDTSRRSSKGMFGRLAERLKNPTDTNRLRKQPLSY